MGSVASEEARLVSDASVAVIIVNYRTPTLTADCVESVLRAVGCKVHIFVVDNDSGDDSVPLLRARFGEASTVTLMARSVNDGYTGGNNAGLALARERGARFAFVLNSDTVVAPDCLRLLVEEIESDAHIGIVCPRIFYGDEPELLWFGGAIYSPWRGRAVHVGLRQPASAGWNERRDLPFATGCALLLRLEACAPPEFDASLFAYAEDLDLSLRMRAKGYRIRFVPEATMWHHEASSHRGQRGQSLRFYLSTRNLLRVVSRNARWYQWPVLAPMLAVNVVGRFGAVALRNGDISGARAVLLGAWDAMASGNGPVPHSGSNERT
jgi:hypothetical protein